MAVSTKEHAAVESATGYLYQCRQALLLALREIPNRPQLSISIERFDDVAFDANGTPAELIQTKHHTSKTGDLADMSVDLWKTLGIWSKLMPSYSEPVSPVRFVLLTTGKAPEKSAASLLRFSNRDEPQAAKMLMDAARRSKNCQTKAARRAFQDLSDVQRAALLGAMVVLDCSPNISDARKELYEVLHPAAPRNHVEHFVERLEGWWFNAVIEALRNGNVSISLTEIEDKMDELREGFNRDSLPIDYGGQSAPLEMIDEYDLRPFVQQLRLIEVGKPRINHAVRDFYRAFEQRSRWIREELIYHTEIVDYERRLQESWQPRFDENAEIAVKGASEEEKISMGRDVFRWVERDADVALRNVRERFLCHGSYHMLADIYKVGWHPDYETILRGKVIDYE